MSDNMRIDLSGYKFKLVFLPRPQDKSQIIARIVAVRYGDGKMMSKLESTQHGATEAEALLHLRRHVERELHRILQAVPTGPAGLNISSPATSQPNGNGGGAPPSYSTATGGQGEANK